MHSLNGHVAIASKIQDTRLIPGSRDAFLFMSSFKQSMSMPPWPVCAAPKTSFMLTLTCARSRKGYREGGSLPEPPELPPRDGGRTRKGVSSPCHDSNFVMWTSPCWCTGN